MGAHKLTPSQELRLRGLRRLAALLDSAIPIPGTSRRIGLDPFLGLIPGLGDLVSPLFTVGILFHAWELRVPKVVQARMLINAACDALIGSVPLLGDLFDFAWKANERNLRLLEQHAFEGRRVSGGDWLFVGVSALVIITIAALPLVIVAALISLIGRW